MARVETPSFCFPRQRRAGESMAAGHIIRDAKRVAVPSIRGYRYQLLHTVRAWLLLAENDTALVAEGNEDIDRIFLKDPSWVDEEQIKYRSEPIAQGDDAIAVTVLRYLEAFTIHHAAGRKFRGVLRTNAEILAQPSTEVGKWILGHRVKESTFRNELRRLASGGRARFKPFIKHILPNAITRDFLSSVEWAPRQGELHSLTDEVAALAASRAPNLSAALAVSCLLTRMLERSTLDDVERRTMRRIDADLALNDAALDALRNSANPIRMPSRLTLWSQLGPPSVAVAVFTHDSSSLSAALDLALRLDFAKGIKRNMLQVIRELALDADFIAYVSIRRTQGRKGQAVCIEDVVRQSRHRHTPHEVLLFTSEPPWNPRIAKTWPLPKRVDPHESKWPEFQLAALVGSSVANAVSDRDFLLSLKTKLRWIHEVESREYLTADRLP